MRKMLGLLILLFALPAFAEDLTEEDKIADLLDAVTSPDITFVRNGQPLDGADARKHLEDKRKEIGNITTAKDFINKVASRSRETGKPYIIRLKGGKEIESSEWFHEQLKDIENTKVIE